MIDTKLIIEHSPYYKRRTFLFLKNRTVFEELKYSPSFYKQHGIKEYFVIISKKIVKIKN
jgi:hypothetical protein